MRSVKNINLYTGNYDGIRIDQKKTIFFCGSGVSADWPSNIPTGYELTNLYLDNMLGEYADPFKTYWKQHFPQIAEFVHKDGTWGRPDDSDCESKVRTPRLEFIIGEMDKVDKCLRAANFQKPENQRRFHRESSLRILKDFQFSEPNQTHHKLAQFMKAGSGMITSNWDVCLEKAAGMDIHATRDDMETHGMKAVVDSGMTVYHFHGVSTDDDLQNTLGATLKEISRKLPKSFTDWLRNCFEDGYDIVFVGYGAVDMFDVQPFFESIADKNYPGRAYYVKHCCSDEDAQRAQEDPNKHYQYLLSPFENQTICYADSADFLDYLLSSTGIDCPVFIPTTPTESAKQRIKNDFDNLTANLNDDEKRDYYFLNLFRLCAQMTIHPDHICDFNWHNSINSIVKKWEEDGPQTISNIATSNGFMSLRKQRNKLDHI